MEACLEKSIQIAETAIDAVAVALAASPLPDLPAEKPEKKSEKKIDPAKPPSKFLLSLIDGWKERFCGAPRKAPVAGKEVEVAWRLNDMRAAVAAARKRPDVRAALDGFKKLASSGDHEAAFKKSCQIIQGYVSRLGYGVRRRREGAVKGAESIKGYALGFGSAALCGSVPIPSFAFKKEGDSGSVDLADFVGEASPRAFVKSGGGAVAVPTGMSGMVEQVFCGPDEILRPPLLSSEYASPAPFVEKAGISRRGMILCGSAKCLRCATARASSEDAALTEALKQQVFQGATYAFGTFTVRHFHKDLARQLYALRSIYALFIKNAKRIFERYGCVIVLRKLEITMDDLLENRGHGAHPHYHVIFIFFKKTYDKKGNEIIHNISNINFIKCKCEIKYLWYKCTKEFYDLVPGDNGKTEKYKDAILEHGFNMAFYDDVFCDTEEKKKENDKKILELRQQWDNSDYDLSENVKKFLPDINREWKDNKNHFIKQLAGVSKASNYCSGVGKWNISSEITGGVKKEGQNKSRISYFTWLLQAALIDDPYIDSLASDLICSLNRVRFTTSVKGFLDIESKDSFYKVGSSIDETRKELKEDVFLQKTKGLPQILSGDRIRLDAIVFGDKRYKSMSNFGFERFQEKIQKVAYDALRSLRGGELDADLAKDIYEKEAEKVEAVLERAPDAPKVPAYMLESQAWTPQEQALLPQKRKYIEVLKLLHRYRRDLFVKMCRRLAPDPAAPAGFSVERMREVADPDRHDRVAEAVILAAWPGLKKKLLASVERQRALWPIEAECDRDQARAEKSAIRGVLERAGFYADRRFPPFGLSCAQKRRVDSWFDQARYENLWRDFYGHFEIRRPDGRLVPVEDQERIAAAPLFLGHGVELPAGAGGAWEAPLAGISGWWGIGYRADLFDDRAAATVFDDFDFSVRRGDMVAMGKTGGAFEGCQLVHVRGHMDKLLSEIKRDRRAVIARALVDFSAGLSPIAREAGWRKKDLAPIPDLTLEFMHGVKAKTAPALRRYAEFGVRYGLVPEDFREILAADPRAGCKKYLRALFHPSRPSTWLLPDGADAREWIRPRDPHLAFDMAAV